MMRTIRDTVRDYKTYAELKEQLTDEMDRLKDEMVKYMLIHGIDEIVTDDGKATYREVSSKRMDSTSFKRDYGNLYDSYLRVTHSMRFTFNS